ncbi:ABC transporter substrate-binding protein [Xanthobacter autotrophicus]|uniref:ABC transporter substrate-binding protein n=1 Tax=Xanthobacter autotrophicus TaxID=280 RepID=UPI00372A8849
MLTRVVRLLLPAALLAAAPLCLGLAQAQQPAAVAAETNPPAEAKPLEVRIGLITRAVPPPPLYDLLAVPEDEAVAGAELAVKDNTTTGLFTGQSFALETTTLGEDEDPAQAARTLAANGTRLLIVNLPDAELLKVADAVKDKDAVIFNVGATDDALRAQDCRANVFHVAPSRAMLTDALVQFLASKRWTKLFLITGPQPADLLYAEALRRSAKKFGVKIVADKPWTFGPLGRERSDSITRSDALVFSRGVDADVIVVADEANDFGTYIAFRTYEPRLVVGTQGLTAATWHPAQDAYGSAQLQSRFLRSASRTMRPVDYQAWVAARMIGEATTRTKSADPATLAKFMRTPDFSLAAFKGVPVSIRPWDQQLRQPLLIAQPLDIVSMAPEDGFLHQRTPLDTLGIDEGESRCRLK